jgi:transposase
MERREDFFFPGLLNPSYSVSHAFPNHDKLIGSLNPCNDGGLVGKALVLCFSHRMAGGVKNMDKTSFRGFLGIDVSKDTFDACCIDMNGEKQFHLSCSMDRSGFEKLASRLETVAISPECLLIGMESTACYHMNLFSFLLAGGYTAVVINPLLIANFVKLQLRKTKTDKKDALVIAQYLLMHRDAVAPAGIAPHIADLRDLSRQRESLLTQITALKCDMKRLLTMTFPELEKLTGVFTKSILQLVRRFPSAHAIAQADPAEIAQLLAEHSMGRNASGTAQAIIKAARSSVGTTSPSRELILTQKAEVLIHLEGHVKELTAMMIELCRADMGDDIDIMTSLRGIGEQTATTFLAEMGGDIRKFNNHKKLIAMAGLDPAIYQSGTHEGHGRITKRGNRHLRRVIWQMTIRVIQFNDCFRQYYTKRRQDGLPFKKAVLATAHKLLRVIFAMLTQRTLFHYVANS